MLNASASSSRLSPVRGSLIQNKFPHRTAARPVHGPDEQAGPCTTLQSPVPQQARRRNPPQNHCPSPPLVSSVQVCTSPLSDAPTRCPNL